jgi:hypothetical protein
MSPAAEPLSHAEQVAVSVQPYFVQSTASASEILTNVAVQDLLAAEDARLYELSCHPATSSALSSTSDPWDMFDYVNPVARDGSSESASDSDSELIEEPVEESGDELAEEPADESSQSMSTPSHTPKLHEALEPASLPPFVHINRTIRLISSSVVEVTFRNTYPDSPPGEDDDEEVVNIPISTFPHPHRLSPILEEDEEYDFSDVETVCEGGLDASDAETIRPSSISFCPRLDAGIDWTSCAERYDSSCESNLCFRTDRRMSI